MERASVVCSSRAPTPPTLAVARSVPGSLASKARSQCVCVEKMPCRTAAHFLFKNLNCNKIILIITAKNSKLLFFRFLDILDEYMKEGSTKFCYCDTDSFLIAMTETTLDECVKDEMKKSQVCSRKKPEYHVAGFWRYRQNATSFAKKSLAISKRNLLQKKMNIKLLKY
jgi:hypothetical protein